MLVEGITRRRTAEGCELSATIRSPSRLTADRLQVTVRNGEPSWLSETGDAFLAALVLPAMALREELAVKAPISRRIVRSARTVMDIYAAWWAEVRPVPITATTTASTATTGAKGVGLFFTTGVDSFYSLLKDVERQGDPHHDPVTHLLFANFEEQSGPHYERLLTRIEDVAEATGRSCIVVETNIRKVFDPIILWPAYHGAALAAVALALQGLLGRCLIAASDEYRHLPPLGSHPLLDHLWSTERIEIVHDGAEATRTDKIERQIARSRLAMENLSVCWVGRPGQNCGRCEKCLRTMVTLDLAGALGRCPTLPSALDMDRLRTVPMRSEDARDAMRSVVADARRRGRHDIVDAAEEALSRSPSSGSGSAALLP